MPRYALDTNLYIHAIRDAARAAELDNFYDVFLPFTHLSSVVAQELAAGASDRRRGAEIQAGLIDPFERRGRIFTPSHAAWKRSGEVLAELAATEGLELKRVPKSLVNDVLLALSCREAGVILVTENERDFRRIRKLTPFDFVPPWPTRP